MFLVLVCDILDFFLLVLKSFGFLYEVSRYTRGFILWCYNREMNVLWVQFVLDGDTVPTCGQYLEF